VGGKVDDVDGSCVGCTDACTCNGSCDGCCDGGCDGGCDGEGDTRTAVESVALPAGSDAAVGLAVVAADGWAVTSTPLTMVPVSVPVPVPLLPPLLVFVPVESLRGSMPSTPLLPPLLVASVGEPVLPVLPVPPTDVCNMTENRAGGVESERGRDCDAIGVTHLRRRRRRGRGRRPGK